MHAAMVDVARSDLGARMRILIPADDMRSLPSLYEAYRAMGCDVVIGVENLRLRAASFDIVHVQFPEAFSAWRVPTAAEIQRTVEDLACGENVPCW